MTAPNTFTRLQARRRGFVRHASIWDAGEYLLSVSGTSFSERYHRFYYRDIEAIVVQKGPRVGSIGAMMVLALVALVFGISVAVAPYPSSLLVHVFWLAPLTWLGIIMYINLTRSCRVFIYTAVSSEELPAIFRRSAAERVLPRIVDQVRASQGSFGEAYQAAMANHTGIPEGNSQSVPSRLLQQNLTSATPQTLYAAAAYFVIVLASAAFAFWYRDALLTPKSLTLAKVLFCVINALGVFTGAWALLKSLNLRLMNGLRIAVFSGLGLLALRTYALYFTLLSLRTVRGTLTETMASVHWRQWLGAGDCTLSLLIGVAGVTFLIFAWQGYTIGPVGERATPDKFIA